MEPTSQSPPGIYSYDTIEAHRRHMQYISVDGGRMAHLDIRPKGKQKGLPVLLMHGVPTSSWLYRHIIPQLVRQGRRVIVPDMLGYGSSDKPKGVEIYNSALQGQRLVELMNQLRIKTWVHVCHDAGGIWTWEMIAHAPGRVAGLVILNTILFREGFHPPLTLRRGSIWAKLYASLYNSRLFCRLMINGTLKNGISDGTPGLSRADKKGYWLPMSEGVSRALYQFFTSFEEIYQKLPSFQKVLASQNIPSLIIWGMKDNILKGSEQIPLAQDRFSIPEHRIHPLENAVHFIQEDDPDTLAGLISDFQIRP